jgi:hypothetical protein
VWKVADLRAGSRVVFDEKSIGTTFRALNSNPVEINAVLCQFCMFFDVLLTFCPFPPKTKYIFEFPVKFYYRIRPEQNLEKVTLS